MNTVSLPFSDTLPEDMLAEMREAARQASMGVRVRSEALKARAAWTRFAKEIRKEHGVLDIGVPAIRELRGE